MSKNKAPQNTEKVKESTKKISPQKSNSSAWKYIRRTLSVVGVTLLALIIAVYGMGLILTHGPSDDARQLFVLSLLETSAAKWVPSLFLSDSEISAIKGNSAPQPDEEVSIDPGLIQIPQDNSKDDSDESFESDIELSQWEEDNTTSTPEVDTDGIEIVDIVGGTYRGKLMIVKDPSRVFVATLDAYGETENGITLKNFIKKYDAVGGVNAGGFVDPQGTGTGGIPDGLVIGNSQVMWGGLDKHHKCVIGFDKDNILHVGSFSGAEALSKNIVSAVSFAPGPILVVNGKPMNETQDLGGGLNPRTAIGQRSDGAVLLLVVDGRQVESLGATYDDLVDIMMEYGAVNAANLDGGSSTRMMYDGEVINDCASLIGERTLPNCILVRKAD